MRAGKDAIEELVLSPTSCAGATARWNSRSVVRPNTTATGYQRTTNRSSIAETKTMKPATTPAATPPAPSTKR